MSQDNNSKSESLGDIIGLGFLIATGVVVAVGFGIFKVVKAFAGHHEGEKLTKQQIEQARVQAAREAEAVRRIEAEQKAEQARVKRLKQAENEGLDVCWDCRRIKPNRCNNGHCQACVSHCGCGQCRKCVPLCCNCGW